MTDDLREALTKAIDRADPPGGMRAGTPSISVAVLRTLLAAHPARNVAAEALCLADTSWEHHDRTDDFPCSSCVSDTRREDVTRAQREITSAVVEADEWLTEHRVSESWRVINRLRDTLVRTSDVLAALPAPPVVDEATLEREARVEIIERLGREVECADGPRRIAAFVNGALYAAARLRGATRG